MAAPRELAELQEWLLSVVTHPRGAAAGALDTSSAVPGVPIASIESLIRPGQRQSSLERVTVYANAYYARLMQCLRELFPATRAAVGDELFDDFAFGYLQAHPPRSYTLGRLADRFVEYLERTRHESDEDRESTANQDAAWESRRARRTEYGAETERASTEGGDSAPPPCSPWLPSDPPADFTAWARFVVELARFEQTIDEVFDGPGLEGSPSRLAEQLAEASAEELGSARLALAPSLRLLRCEFPINDYFTSYRRGAAPEPPPPAESFVAVARRDYAVRRHELTATQYELLTALGAGQSLAQAVERLGPALESVGGADALRGWFAAWTEAGFFAGLNTSSSFVSQEEKPNG